MENSFKSEEKIQEFNTNYSEWKKWRTDNFGVLKISSGSYFDAEIARTRRKFLPNTKVLEIGFGSGEFLSYAKNKEWNVVGVELNADMVKLANLAGFEAHEASMLTLFEEASFDLIVAFDVLEHIDSAELFNFLSNIKRILTKNGTFIARFPNGDSPFGLANQNGDFTHKTVIGSGKIDYIAEKLNFELVYVGADAQPIFGVEVKYFLYRIFSLPIKYFLDWFINLVFFPYKKVVYCSSNITAIFRLLEK